MFCDPIMQHSDPSMSVILRALGSCPQRLSEGVYTHCGYNFGNAIERGACDEYFYDEDVPSYGVVDSIDQFMEIFGPRIRENPQAFAVGFTEVRREDEPEQGGRGGTSGVSTSASTRSPASTSMTRRTSTA